MMSRCLGQGISQPVLMEPAPSLPPVRIRRLLVFPVFPILALLLSGCTSKNLDVVTLRPSGLGRDLFAYWPMDEGSGTTVKDEGPQGRIGTLAGTATWTTHEGFGGALHFEAPTDEVQVTPFPQVPQNKPDWSVSLWVKLPAQEAFNNDNYLTIISTEVPKGGNGPNSGGGWEMNLGRPPPTTAGVPTTSYLYQFAYWVGPDVGKYMKIESPNAPVNVWTHLVAVVDGSVRTLSLYQNGVLVMPPVPVTDLIKPTGNTTLFMGAWFSPQSRRFTGDLDDVAIYNRVLTSDEVATLHSGPIPPEYLMPGMDGGQGGSQP